MIAPYFRSSSYNQYDICEHSYFLQYVLGYPSKANKAAVKGNIVHKVLEILAKHKLAQQNNILAVADDEINYANEDGIVLIEDILNKSYQSYIEKEKQLDWKEQDYKDCTKWVNMATTYQNGAFNPLNRNIHTVEQFFDFQIKKPWAEYKYKLRGQDFQGYLALRGTMDLIIKIDDSTLELTDYKTGQCKNWKTGQRKVYKDFYDDPQLRLYHYAASYLYPQVECILFTIYYIRDGGPFTIPFHKEDLPKTEEIIRQRFVEVKANQKPKLIFPNFWCFKLCAHSAKMEGSTKSICQFFRDEVIQLGMTRVTEKYAKDLNFKDYTGGGKTI